MRKRDKEFLEYIKGYSGIVATVLVVISLFVQGNSNTILNNLYVTSEKLEMKHREILSDVDSKYSTKEQYNNLKSQLDNMQMKIDKMYDIITRRGS